MIQAVFRSRRFGLLGILRARMVFLRPLLFVLVLCFLGRLAAARPRVYLVTC